MLTYRQKKWVAGQEVVLLLKKVVQCEMEKRWPFFSFQQLDVIEVTILGFHIVLYQPEIPYNTGNIARTCAATNTKLHIIRPMGFSTDDKMLKRAGCDYWHSVDITYYDSMDQLFEQYPTHRFFFVETKGRLNYTEVNYRDGDFFVFGKETTGIPKSILEQHQDTWVRLPMSQKHVRSLNLSNTAAIMVYEALRQVGFPELD